MACNIIYYNVRTRPVWGAGFLWEGRFVGNALEPAKALKKGQAIDIINGWVDKDTWTAEDGKKREKTFVVITDFKLSDFVAEEDDLEGDETDGKEVDDVEDVYRSLNGDENTPANSGEKY